MISVQPLLVLDLACEHFNTTAEETYLKFKRCFTLSSIGASLTEDDALERCISIKHPKLSKAKSQA